VTDSLPVGEVYRSVEETKKKGGGSVQSVNIRLKQNNKKLKKQPKQIGTDFVLDLDIRKKKKKKLFVYFFLGQKNNNRQI
jgi:hypothetical protein